jgi:hypothetical protein
MRKAFVAVVVGLSVRRVLKLFGDRPSEGMSVFVGTTKTDI